MFVRESTTFGGKELTIETGRMAKQANGAVLVTYGDTSVLVTAVSDKDEKDVPFLPLTVEYTERMYAAGRIPGSYFRREGRPSVDEILACRLIDRPIRPLFPEGFRNDTQVIAMVLSADQKNPADVLAVTGASTALHISDIAWTGPLAAVRVGKVNGQLIANPTIQELKESVMNVVVVVSFDALVMVEGEFELVSEDEVVEALVFAQEQARPVLELQEKIRAAVGKEKRTFTPVEMDESLVTRVKDVCGDRIAKAVTIKSKHERYAAIDALKKAVIEELGEEFEDRAAEVSEAYSEVKRRFVRNLVVSDKIRLDGRQLDEIRPISVEVGVLGRTHGSSLFTRGETQALATATLATARSDQRIESINGDYTKSFMLHYNFPPFSTGEARRFGSPGRREIGHGNLAERSLKRVLPEYPEDFPYVIRVVSETLESNGSSSMAAVCGGCLSLMDAGVPIKAPVAGIAMGLIYEDGQYRVLSDILGDEDHLGDMDFKVTGTKDGICAIQMDIKLESVPREVLVQALEQARKGRMHILGKMAEGIAEPRPELSPVAPRIMTVKVKVDRIRDIIGPGGKMIRAIQEESGAEINVDDDGTVTIASADGPSAQKAMDLIEGLTAEAEIGTTYRGKVKRITDFGAFVEILPGTDGLCHISELENQRVEKVSDVCKEGEEMVVKVLNVDRDGKIRLSRKQAFDVDPSEIRKMV